MSSVVHYGSAGSLSFDLPSKALVANCAVPNGEVLCDVAEAVAGALAEPLEFPALSQATVPGDRIVLAVENELPQTAELVAAAVRYPVRAGTLPEAPTRFLPQSAVSRAARPPRRVSPSDVSRPGAHQGADPQAT